MKTKALLFALFVVVPFFMNAQSDYSNYLNKAMTKLDEGDCDAAQKFYNVYKELAGKSVSSIEVLIKDCKDNQSNKAINYAINDKIKVGEYLYRVAYIEDNGAHGIAICDYGAGPLTDKMVTDRMLPTRSEMALISSNAEQLKLNKYLYYWTLDRYDSGHNYTCRLSDYSIDIKSRESSHAILLIYRF